MKPLLAILGGFSLSLGMFAGGILLATYSLTAKPVSVTAKPVSVQSGETQDVTQLWTATPRKVDPNKQDFERVAASVLPLEQDEGVAVAGADPAVWPEVEAGVDVLTTSSLNSPTDASGEPSRDVQLDIAHQQWCANRFRSYQPETNSYRPYRGGRRSCVSPYSGGAEASQNASEGALYVVEAEVTRERAAQVLTANKGPDDWISSWHVQSCFDRYRSYRPEDNTYQPYGGGPRMQCQS